MEPTDWLATSGYLPSDLIDAVGFGVLVLSPDGVVRAVNTEVTRLLRWTPAQLVGVDVHESVHIHPRSTDPSSACPLVAPATTGLRAADEADYLRCADGTLLPVSWVSTPLRHDPDGTHPLGEPSRTGVVVSFTDATDRQALAVADAASREQDRADLRAVRQSVSDLGWIAELTRVMSTTVDEVESLNRLARLLTPRLADIAIVDLVDDAGNLRRLGGSVAPGVEIDLDEMLRDPRVAHRSHDDTTKSTIATSSVSVFDRSQMRDPAVFDAPSRTLLERIAAESMVVVPFAARGSMTGLAALLRFAPDAYTDEDVLLAADIGRRAGLVLDNARLFRRQQLVAADLQLALLPEVRDTPTMRAAARYLPAQDRLRVGGDWYDLFTCSDEDATILVIGDVAGHDLKAATTMAALRNLLRGIAVTTDSGPAGTMSEVDGSMRPLDIAGTATALLLSLERRDDRWSIRHTNAGHLPGMVVGADGELVELGLRPDPLLGTRAAPERHDHTVEVGIGSTVVLYTDGLIENRDEPIDAGLTRLRQALLAAPKTAHPEELLDFLLERLPRSPDDDTALIVARLL